MNSSLPTLPGIEDNQDAQNNLRQNLEVGFGDYASASFAQAWDRNITPEFNRWQDRDWQQAENPGNTLSPEDANKQYGIPGALNFDKPIAENVAKMIRAQRDKELLREDTIRRGGDSFAVKMTGGAMSLVAGILDPVNIAASFIPVVGEANLARITTLTGAKALATGAIEGTIKQRLATRAIVGATEGVVGQGVLEPGQYFLNRDELNDYTMADSLGNMAFGGILGGGLHAGKGVIDDILKGLKSGEREALLRSKIAGGDITPVLDVHPAVVASDLIDQNLEIAKQIARSVADRELTDLSKTLDPRNVDLAATSALDIADEIGADTHLTAGQKAEYLLPIQNFLKEVNGYLGSDQYDVPNVAHYQVETQPGPIAPASYFYGKIHPIIDNVGEALLGYKNLKTPEVSRVEPALPKTPTDRASKTANAIRRGEPSYGRIDLAYPENSAELLRQITPVPHPNEKLRFSSARELVDWFDKNLVGQEIKTPLGLIVKLKDTELFRLIAGKKGDSKGFIDGPKSGAEAMAWLRTGKADLKDIQGFDGLRAEMLSNLRDVLENPSQILQEKANPKKFKFLKVYEKGDWLVAALDRETGELGILSSNQGRSSRLNFLKDHVLVEPINGRPPGDLNRGRPVGGQSTGGNPTDITGNIGSDLEKVNRFVRTPSEAEVRSEQARRIKSLQDEQLQPKAVEPSAPILSPDPSRTTDFTKPAASIEEHAARLEKEISEMEAANAPLLEKLSDEEKAAISNASELVQKSEKQGKGIWQAISCYLTKGLF